MNSKYIFVAGAPGSKWSSVVKNIYYSNNIDRTDYRDTWTYYHDASGTMELMHLGAYFDPGMASPLPMDLTLENRQQLEERFARPFQSHNFRGIRIIKSHIFSNHIDYLRELFPEVPIVMVHRSDDSCLGWWVKCGHFDITYPDYREYFKNLKHMAKIIQSQNNDISTAWTKYPGVEPKNNRELAQALSIAEPPEEYQQDYIKSDIRVKVI